MYTNYTRNKPYTTVYGETPNKETRNLEYDPNGFLNAGREFP